MRLPSRRDRSFWIALAIGVAALALRAGYVSVTPFNVRDHDVGGHIEYIEYLLNHHAFPKSGDGWSFYHPAFYFLLAAVQWALLAVLHVGRAAILVSLQIQSIVWELGFALFSIATAKLWLDELPDENFGSGLSSRGALLALFATLILVWPSTVIHAARIGNDDLVYLFFGACLYFASQWWLRGRDRDLNLAALAAALGVITKTNALILFVVLGVLFLVRLGLTEKERRPARFARRGWPIVALGVVSAGMALGTAVRDALAGNRSSVLIGNADMVTAKLKVGNRAENYLWFDLPTFVNQAFSSPWDDAHGRQWFWNYTLKTGLFGEFNFDSPLLWNIAVCISVVFVALFVHFLAGLFLAAGSGKRELPLRVTAIVLIASLAALRMRHPMSCSNDFRYILPILTPVLCIHLRALAQLRARGRVTLATSGVIIGWLFAGLSMAFIVVLVGVSWR